MLSSGELVKVVSRGETRSGLGIRKITWQKCGGGTVKLTKAEIGDRHLGCYANLPGEEWRGLGEVGRVEVRVGKGLCVGGHIKEGQTGEMCRSRLKSGKQEAFRFTDWLWGNLLIRHMPLSRVGWRSPFPD